MGRPQNLCTNPMTHPSSTTHPIHWLHHADQRLGLLPSLGGSVAAWQRDSGHGVTNLWRPWAGVADLYTTASFPLVPWSNRIGHGGFHHAGVHRAMRTNRAGEPYPIHGDGWLQAWELQQPSADTLELHLESAHFDGNPYHYRALQRFVLHEEGMDQSLEVTHLGASSLPYGLGQHPAFLRTPTARLHAQVEGVWLSGADPIPTHFSTQFPAGWDPRGGMQVSGSLIDNAYAGWNGRAHIDWPEHALRLHLRDPSVNARGRNDGYCLLYRPAEGAHFCFEPVTHPIDAFHMEGFPGMQILEQGQTLHQTVEWRFELLPA